MVPKNLVLLDKWSPTNSVPIFFGSPQAVPLDKQTNLGTICLGRPNWLGILCPWGPNWFGTICPEEPINRGPIVGDQISGAHISLGPNVSQPKMCRVCLLGLIQLSHSTLFYLTYNELSWIKTHQNFIFEISLYFYPVTSFYYFQPIFNF